MLKLFYILRFAGFPGEAEFPFSGKKGRFMKKTIYYNGDILTMEPGGMPDAVLTEDGVIRAVGTREALFARSGRDTALCDLQGHTLLPAFIDPHSHITAYAKTVSLVSLEGCKSFEEIAERICRFQNENNLRKGEWISGFGYDQNDLKEGRHPDKTLLDQACGEHPVLISHASGHMGVANTLALHEIGVTAQTPDPQGGHIGRLPDGREPDGYLEETAFTGIKGLPQPTLEEQCSQMRRAQDAYLRYGITTVQDGLTRADEWRLLKLMAGQNALKLDIVSYIDLNLCKNLVRENPQFVNRYQNRLKIGGYKVFLDGSPQGRTAWMSRPYEGSDDGDYRGYPVYQDGQMREFMRIAESEGLQILAHCNGDAAAQQMIDAYAQAHAQRQRDIRPVMIHAQLVRPDQLTAMRRLSMTASFFAAHTWYWGDTHLKNFGRERGARISPAGSALRSGVNFTFHQDTPVVPPDMLFTIWCAVNRVTKDGEKLSQAECITPYEALEAVTVNAAWQYFEEDAKGSIRAGKRADLVILDRNPLRVNPMEIRNIQVLRTIKDGETVYEKTGSEKAAVL